MSLRGSVRSLSVLNTQKKALFNEIQLAITRTKCILKKITVIKRKQGLKEYGNSLSTMRFKEMLQYQQTLLTEYNTDILGMHI